MIGRILHEMPFREYLDSDGVSSSDLKAFRMSPAYYRWRKANGSSDTPSTTFGRAAHCAILTPHLLLDEVYIAAEGEEWRTKDQKAKKAHLEAQGKAILSYADGRRLHAIRAAVCGRDDWQELVDTAEGIECSVFWQGEHDVMKRRCRPDLFTPTIVADLKIMHAASQGLEACIRSALSWGYGHQLAGNAAGLRAAGFDRVRTGLLVCVSPTPPHEVFTFFLRFGESQLELLELENQRTIEQLKACHDSNVWPTGGEEWHDVVVQDSFSVEDDELDLSGVTHA